MDFVSLQSKLKNITVGIAGAGGLGSNCAVALARVGIGKLIVVDFDSIVESNLNRQYYFIDQLGQKKVFALRDNLTRINPNVVVDVLDLKLDATNVSKTFASCQIIVEAFDKAEMKHMIIETILSELPEKYMVAGVGLAGWGDNNSIKTKQEGHLFVCGDEINEVSELKPPLAPRVGVVANMQANQVLEIIEKYF